MARHVARVLRAEADYDEGLIEACDLKRIRDKESAAIDNSRSSVPHMMPTP